MLQERIFARLAVNSLRLDRQILKLEAFERQNIAGTGVSDVLSRVRWEIVKLRGESHVLDVEVRAAFEALSRRRREGVMQMLRTFVLQGHRDVLTILELIDHCEAEKTEHMLDSGLVLRRGHRLQFDYRFRDRSGTVARWHTLSYYQYQNLCSIEEDGDEAHLLSHYRERLRISPPLYRA